MCRVLNAMCRKVSLFFMCIYLWLAITSIVSGFLSPRHRRPQVVTVFCKNVWCLFFITLNLDSTQKN
jgi:hypothetical protein